VRGALQHWSQSALQSPLPFLSFRYLQLESLRANEFRLHHATRAHLLLSARAAGSYQSMHAAAPICVGQWWRLPQEKNSS